ncbi:helix-turn-helix domain-containing protein [Empedobacter brevis]|uniref:helix-turn-helix domain-containing protein n=1 Tax=Empedobacter brevis TaxID=247 RepID=UPI002FE39E7D
MSQELETIADYYNKISAEQAELMKSVCFEQDKAHFNISLRRYCSFRSPYSRRDYYKISLFIGEGVFKYGNAETYISKPILFLPPPHLSYTWECKSSLQEGYFCLFNQQFFTENKEFEVFKRTSLFKDWGSPFVEISEKDLPVVISYFEQMYRLNQSKYPLRYHSIRNHLSAVFHYILEQKVDEIHSDELPSNMRLYKKFDELLNTQFPLDSPAHPLLLKTPADFSHQLNVHVNHLNSSVKSVTNQTTTQIIKQKIIEEAKSLLRYTDWDIAEVGYTLGFEEPAHFNNFFKKHTQTSPLKFKQRK